MADPLVDLTTLAAAKVYLTGAGVVLPADPVLEALITAVSAQMQAHLARRIPSQSYSVRVSGRDEGAIFLPNTPITAVSLLKISGQDVAAAPDATARGYIVAPEAIYLRGHWAERGVQNIEIEYTAGFAAIPADLVRACHLAIETGIASWSTGQPGAVFLKAGDTEIDFGAVSIIASQCITPQITSMLEKHRRVVPC